MKLTFKKPIGVADHRIRSFIYHYLEGSELLNYENYIQIRENNEIYLLTFKKNKLYSISQEEQLQINKKLFPLKLLILNNNI